MCTMCLRCLAYASACKPGHAQRQISAACKPAAQYHSEAQYPPRHQLLTQLAVAHIACCCFSTCSQTLCGCRCNCRRRNMGPIADVVAFCLYLRDHHTRRCVAGVPYRQPAANCVRHERACLTRAVMPLCVECQLVAQKHLQFGFINSQTQWQGLGSEFMHRQNGSNAHTHSHRNAADRKH